MARYIDADALSHKFFEMGCHITKIHPMDVMNIISEQPTAYDVEKVVAELEKAKEECYVLETTTGEPYKYYYQRQAFENAIDIVKRGGVE